MKFVKVNNTILNISTGEVQFRHGDTPTTLRRIHRRRTQWMLRRDGIYVRKELADAYGLTH
jgi:hypothetical protein